MIHLQHLSLPHLKKIKTAIVPSLFTAHQFHLLEKKLKNKSLTNSQKNEFSRSISKRLNAIYTLLGKPLNNTYIYGKEKIIPQRLQQATLLLKRYERKFPHKHLILSGSFLYNKTYNDIDIFIISKYDKEDCKEKKIHFNYLTQDVYSSAFYTSLTQLCISNREITTQLIQDTITLDTFISLYQELLNDIDQNPHALKHTLREFLLQSSYLSNSSLPNSQQLKHQSETILHTKKPTTLIKNKFIDTLLFSQQTKEIKITLPKLIKSYQELCQEYPQHQSHYQHIIFTFKEVMNLASS